MVSPGVTFNPNPGDNKRLSLRLNLKVGAGHTLVQVQVKGLNQSKKFL